MAGRELDRLRRRLVAGDVVAVTWAVAGAHLTVHGWPGSLGDEAVRRFHPSFLVASVAVLARIARTGPGGGALRWASLRWAASVAGIVVGAVSTREFVHHVQQARKENGLDYADRIRVTFQANPEMAAAVDANRAWIQGETLAVGITGEAGPDLRIQIEKISPEGASIQ